MNKPVLIAVADAQTRLSDRDLVVLRLMVEGFADKEIAREIGVSVFTVNKSVQSILRHTNATSRTQAAVKALKQGIVD
jgi:DNA-binding NarL/FixJ family response regulator